MTMLLFSGDDVLWPTRRCEDVLARSAVRIVAFAMVHLPLNDTANRRAAFYSGKAGNIVRTNMNGAIGIIGISVAMAVIE